MVDFQDRRIDAQHADVESHHERLDWHYGELRTKVDKLVEDCIALFEQVAGPASEDPQNCGQLSTVRDERTTTVPRAPANRGEGSRDRVAAGTAP